jgi:DnaJ family protein C protein 1
LFEGDEEHTVLLSRLAELAKYMKKYPVGTPERWEKIADALNRSVVEVTHFAKKMKENAFR